MTTRLAVLGMAALLACAGAFAEPIPSPTPYPEDDLWEIVNTVYGTSFSSNGDLTFAQVDYETDHNGLMNYTEVEAEAIFAANTQQFGVYVPTLPSTPAFGFYLFGGSISGMGYLSGVTDAFAGPPGYEYGFFLETHRPNGDLENYWFSEDGQNTGGEDHLVTYDLGLLTGDALLDGYLLMAWEDKPFGSADLDYNDLVITLHKVVIPEPASMLLLGLGAAGLAARRWTRKG